MKCHMIDAAYACTETLEAARMLAQTEGMIMSPESAHFFNYRIDEAQKGK
jgi:predicted alternative tryptophan synthase beta-subunit